MESSPFLGIIRNTRQRGNLRGSLHFMSSQTTPLPTTRASSKSPGKAPRQGISLMEIMEMFPDEASAVAWFERAIWINGRCCGHCGSLNTKPVKSGKPMPYWCPDCRSYFSVRTGTPMAHSNVKLRKWVIAIYLCLTSLKSVSSMKLHRDIGVSQPAAWFMLHRIREAWAVESGGLFAGPVEVDETFVGGKAKNMHETTRAHHRAQSGGIVSNKIAVAGIKDRTTKRVRARVVPNTNGPTLWRFVAERTTRGVTLYTDEQPAYKGLANHESVRHSAGEYVKGMAHTNGLESFWSMLKRAHMGTFHKLSPKHLDRYVQEFAEKQNMRELDTIAQMRLTVLGLVGRGLPYRALIADNGLPSGARRLERFDTAE